jgi:aspartyl-tRNA(Asn)/glutamyl-tRNA(Gln) amidotransferase subunit B
MLESGEKVVQETRLWDSNQNVTFSMRSKEEAHDYRYFPDPDLVPVLVDETWQESIRSHLPELPTARRDHYVDNLALPRYDADVLTADKDIADYFEETLSHLSSLSKNEERENAKLVSNWIMTDVMRGIGENNQPVADFPIRPNRLASMVSLILDGTISGKIAKDLFEEMLTNSDEPKSIVEKRGWIQVSDTAAIEAAIDEVLAANQMQVQQFLGGNEKVFGFFVGETMKKMKGKGNPKIVNQVLRQKLLEKK